MKKKTEDLGPCLHCGMNPLDFYGANPRKKGILCDLKIDNGAHEWALGCTCSTVPHSIPCAFANPLLEV